ncbi:MAG: hypothetical protein V3S13_00200 [Candidatus Omnitrophota bacterium]
MNNKAIKCRDGLPKGCAPYEIIFHPLINRYYHEAKGIDEDPEFRVIIGQVIVSESDPDILAFVDVEL